MALRFIDSCGDNYTSAQLQASRKYEYAGIAGVSAAGGRFGTNGLLINATSYTKTLDAQATWVAGCAYIVTNFNSSTQNVITFLDGGTEQVSLRITGTGQLFVSRAGTNLALSTYFLPANQFHYFEFKATIGNTGVGSYEVRVDGVSVLSASGVDTQNTANATANQVRWSGGNQVGVIDDVYTCDATGSVNNDFLGDIKVVSVLPSANGANTGLTPSTGVDHAALVDETTANDDTDYNQSDVVGSKDTYDMGALPGNWGAIYGAQVNMVAKKDDAGARSICAVTRSGGADYDGAAKALGTTFVNHFEIVELDPDTSALWADAAAIDAAEFGMKVQA